MTQGATQTTPLRHEVSCDQHLRHCRGLAGATPQSVRDMFSAGMAPARPAGTVLEASDDKDLADEYRAKQPKGPFVSHPAHQHLSRGFA